MTMSDGGKGSTARPFSVSQEEYDNRWDAIFRDAIFRRDGLEDSDKTEKNVDLEISKPTVVQVLE